MRDGRDDLSSFEPRKLSRRDSIKRALKIGGAAYVAPMILSSAVPALAQVSGNPNPECIGATCTTFRQCSTNTDCVCATVPNGGGFCVPGSTSCATLTVCGAGNTCPAGSLCALNSCCGPAFCVPTSLQCPASGAGTVLQPQPGTGSTTTIGGR